MRLVTMPQIILDIGSNHNQDIDRLKRIINSVPVGVWGIKLQDFDPDTLYRNGENADALRKAALPEWELSTIKQLCNARNLKFGITPFSAVAAGLLTKNAVDFIKISSFDSARYSLIDLITSVCSEDDIPLYISTGLISSWEIEDLMIRLGEACISDICFMNCISEYPTEIKDCNTSFVEFLRTAQLETMGRAFPGFSSHCVNPIPILSAVSLGARAIEIHYDFDKQGNEYHHGHCWLPEEAQKLLTAIQSFIDCQGGGVCEHDFYVDKNKYKRADSIDGMRPMRIGGK